MNEYHIILLASEAPDCQQFSSSQLNIPANHKSSMYHMIPKHASI